MCDVYREAYLSQKIFTVELNMSRKDISWSGNYLDTKGLIDINFFEKGATVNSASYCHLLRQNLPYLLNNLRTFPSRKFFSFLFYMIFLQPFLFIPFVLPLLTVQNAPTPHSVFLIILHNLFFVFLTCLLQWCIRHVRFFTSWIYTKNFQSCLNFRFHVL